MSYLGDFAEDYATLNFKFLTRNVQGAGSPPFALASGVISVYKANGTTQSVAGVTLTTPFDSVTGLANVLIDLSSDSFYATGNDYQVVITTGTVNSISVVGEVVTEFSIENRFKDVNVTAISGDSSAADNLESACDNYSVTRGLTGTALPAAAADAAGGVTVSYFEQVQNTYNYYWSLEDVQQQLDRKMTDAFASVHEMAQKMKVHNRLGAYMVAVARVAQACKIRGWV